MTYNVREISSPSPSLPLLAKTNALQRGLSATAQLLVLVIIVSLQTELQRMYVTRFQKWGKRTLVPLKMTHMKTLHFQEWIQSVNA